MTKDMEKRDKLEYARAYIVPQEYKNLYPACDALFMGTIFEDLYRPYKKIIKKINERDIGRNDR